MYDPSDQNRHIEPVGDDQPWPALRETTLAEIEARILELDEHSASRDVLAWLDRMSAFAQAAKELRDAVYKAACAWIAANGDLRLNDDVPLLVRPPANGSLSRRTQDAACGARRARW